MRFRESPSASIPSLTPGAFDPCVGSRRGKRASDVVALGLFAAARCHRPPDTTFLPRAVLATRRAGSAGTVRAGVLARVLPARETGTRASTLGMKARRGTSSPWDSVVAARCHRPPGVAVLLRAVVAARHDGSAGTVRAWRLRAYAPRADRRVRMGRNADRPR